ncbi:MAG TPA: ABC transporter ATP-binding protein [Solirubrobacteraceae bacterium]|nr:ABC transporter ATP-binding protein [Solirubrobacteraceae bacterium]
MGVPSAGVPEGDVGRLELEGVVKHYPGAAEEVRAVDGVSVSVMRGEMVSLLGPSGSGKTTLLLLMAALLRPEAGAIRYGERDLLSLSEREISGYLMYEVGFIFQRSHLWPRSSAIRNAAEKLVASGVGVGDARERVIPWLERVGLGDRLEHPAAQLSGGERQRVAIARVLACEPRLILADEPTGSLDSARSREVVELLRGIAHDRGAMVVLVTHDSTVAALADRCYTLRDGKLTSDESPTSERHASATQD